MIKYDSLEELHFSWYLDELKLNGFIQNWKYHPNPFPLSETIKIKCFKILKTKEKEVIKTLLKEHYYQADFLIKWDEKAKGIFFAENAKEDIMAYPFIIDDKKGFIRSVVDVKGTFNQNDSWRRFSIDQKWVWQKYEILVQKIIPKKLFPETFTPLRYLRVDKKDYARKIGFIPVRSLPQFLRGE